MDATRTAADPQRLELLQRLDLLSDEPDPALDRLTRLAAVATGSESALIAFTAGPRHFIRSRAGPFVGDPFVPGSEAGGACLGVPVMFDGLPLGTVSVLGARPREFGQAQRAILADIAGMVEDLLQSRHRQSLLQQERQHALELAKTLRESEAMLTQAQRLARLGIWDIDVDTGLTAWSPAMYELFERDPADGPITADQFAAGMSEDERAAFEAVVQRAFFEHQPSQAEFRYSAPDGRTRWISAVSEPVRSAEGRVLRLRGTLQDVTESRLTERLAHESAERYRRIVQTAEEGIWMIDAASVTTFVNPKMARMLGYTAAEMVGRSMYDFMDDRARADARENVRRREQGISEQHDFRLTRKDGSDLWTAMSTSTAFDADGRYEGALAMVTDITERRRADQALRESEERFRSLTALSSDWYWEQDEEFRLTKVVGGRAYDNDVGLRRAIGQRPWEAASTDMDPADWERHRRQLQAHEPFRDFEITHRGSDGTPATVSVSGEPVFGNDGRFAGYRGIGRDITEQRRGQALRRELEAQLRDAQKMEAIGVLAGGIAHDFNNVLAGILGNVALAIQDLPAGHPAATSLEQIRKAGLRGRGLVQQILAFARRQPREVVSCELRPLVEECVGLLRSTLPAGVALEAALGGEPLFVMADATQVGQVLMNLCTNAWHSLGGQPGRVVVALAGVELDATGARQLGAGLTPGAYARLSVEDTGRGMDPQTRARIFEPFFTTKPMGEGTGLGLAVAHGIVAAHGGVIRVQTAPGAGSTFEIYLPRSASTRAAGRPAPLAAAHRGNGENVLYIDDDDVMGVLVERLLGRLGYSVTCMDDPVRAIEVLRAAPQAFDVVVTDLNMPELSGLDVARAMHGLRADLPVIISSGNLPDQLQNEARHAGVRALVHKQYTLEELGAVIHWVLAGGQRLGLEPLQRPAR